LTPAAIKAGAFRALIRPGDENAQSSEGIAAMDKTSAEPAPPYQKPAVNELLRRMEGSALEDPATLAGRRRLSATC